jgi:hypothetical protein
MFPISHAVGNLLPINLKLILLEIIYARSFYSLFVWLVAGGWC